MPNATARAPRCAPVSRSCTARPAREVPAPVPEGRRWLTLAVVLSASFLGTLDFFIINLALPSIQADLHANFAHLQLVIAAYGLAYAVCLITGGRLGDLYGRKRLFLAGVAGFTLASALCGLAPGPPALVAARALQGAAGAVLFPQVLAIVQVTFPAHQRGRAFAAFGLAQGAASFSGIVLGGLLVRADLFGLGWRPIFLVNLPVGVLALAAGWALVPESRSPTARRLDPGGVALASAGLLLLVYPLVQGPESGWPGWAFACLGCAPAVLAGFVAYEQRVRARGGSPLVELALFGDRAFAVGLLTTLAFCGGLAAFFLTLTLFLQHGLGLGPTEASLAFAPFAVGYLASSAVAVRLGSRLGRGVIHVGTAAMAGALGWLVVLARARGSALGSGELLPVLLAYGAGQGLVFPSLIRTALSAVGPADAGSASGVLATVQQVAFALGVAVIGGVFSSALGGGGARAHAAALGTALLCNVGLLGLTFGLAFWLPRPSAGETAAPVEL
jgi:EmrB/QacA subfamily drug resistance transporter